MRNRAYIDLKAIRGNAAAIRKKLPEGVKLCAVVKADGYGHGAVRTARALYGLADCLAVALPEEGRELRFAGEAREILVLTPLQPGDEAVAVRHGLTASVSLAEEICRLQAACERAGKGISVHVKLNTGMNRFGAEERDFSALFSAFEAAPLVRPTGVFSHLAAPEDEAFTALQRERFDRMTERLAERCPGLTRHLSASGGFLKGLFYDMVRIGILLYGYAPFPAAFAVRPAMRVSAPVSACRYVEEGERVFYGRQQKKESGYLSVVRFGYADGLPRKDGIFRCMDVSAAEKRMKIGSFTDILNKNANEIAAKYDTISYEVLVGAAKRAERIYEE